MNRSEKEQRTADLLNSLAVPLTIILLFIGCAIGGQIIETLGPWMFGPQNWDTPPGAGTILTAAFWIIVFVIFSRLVDKLLKMS